MDEFNSHFCFVMMLLLARSSTIRPVVSALALLLSLGGCAVAPQGEGESAAAVVAPAPAPPAAAPSAWPETAVVLEQLTMVEQPPLRVPSSRADGRIIGPALLYVHVTAVGEVQKVRLHTSSGNPDMDREVMHFARAMRFAPPVIAPQTAPQAVTLVLPVHLPKSMGAARESWQP
ncbi:MAG: hypothetical protein RL223_3083 [Pseudomonadota bacterium]